MILAHPGSPGQRAVKRVCVCMIMIWYGECCQNLLQFVRRCLAWCRSASDRVAATRRSTSRRPTWPSPSLAAQLVPLTAAPRWWSAAAATATSCWTPINTKVRKAALTHTIHSCLCGGDSVCTVDTGQLLSVCVCGGEILCARWTLASCCLCGCFATFYAYPGICCHYVCKQESTRWNIYLSVIMTFISLITVQ